MPGIDDIGVHGRDDIERTISSSLARFPERFLVSSSSDASLLRLVCVSIMNGGCKLRLAFRVVISASSSSSTDKSKSVSSDELPSVGCINFIGRCFKLLVFNVQTLSILDNCILRSTAVMPSLMFSSVR